MSEQPTPLHIDGSIDIYNAGQLRSTLAEHVRSHDDVVIDLAQTENVDVVGLQLLCSAKKTAVQSGKAFALCNIPACLLALQETLGLSQDLWTKPLE
jgi:anti-anti-sigma factor